jgi:uncharacterized protein YcfJ
MKIPAILLTALMIAPLPAFAGHRRVYEESYCYRNTEEYVPGYYNRYGQYVGGYVKTNRERVPCGYHSRHKIIHQNPHQIDRNSCIEGSVLGGIAGGGLGAALSRGNGRWWAIPLGIVGGSMVGCQIDGG